MRPSSIIATIDGSHVAQARTSTSSVIAQSRLEVGANNIAMQQGELARTAMRLLGMGSAGQAWRGMAQPLIEHAFGGHPAAESGATTWTAARALPTPQGHARSVAIRPTTTPVRSASTREVAPVVNTGDKFRAAVDAAHGPRHDRPARRTRFTIR